MNPSAESHPRAERSAVTGIIVVLIVAGAGLRIAHYVRNPSLSLDESFIALNVLTRSPSDLLETLDFNQGAPLGFLQAQKLALVLFDNSELTLRALPLFAGLVALVLFAYLARRLMNEFAAVLAVGIFSGSSGLVLYATTAKQYAIDAAIACAILLVAERILVTPSVRTLWVVLGVIGSAALWISHPAIFVLAGAAATLSARCLTVRVRAPIGWLGTLVAVWTMNFLAIYEFHLRSLEGLQGTLTGQSGSLAKAAIEGSGSGLITFLRAVMRAVRDAFGVPQIPLAGQDLGDAIALLVAVGLIVGLILFVRRAPFHAVLLVSPIPPLVAAAAVDEYPIFPRTLLFLLPSLIPLLSETLATLICRVAAKRYSFILAVAVAVVAVVATPAFGLVDRFRDGQELKPVLRRLATLQLPGDGLYVFFATQYSFRYYSICGCFGTSEVVARGRELWPTAPARGPHQWAPALRSVPPDLYVGRRVDPSTTEFQAEVRRVGDRRRVWFLVSDVSTSERQTLLTLLEMHGRRLASIGPFSNGTAAAYLVELKPVVATTSGDEKPRTPPTTRERKADHLVSARKFGNLPRTGLTLGRIKERAAPEFVD